MNTLDIVHKRLDNQHLSDRKFETPEQVVSHFGAVQAQDYYGSLWAVGLRTNGATEKDIERAITERKIVRTWPMRGTLHFVHPSDVRWMLKLCTSRIIQRAKGRYKQLELDETVFEKCRALTIKSLAGGKMVTRPQMYEVWRQGGIKIENTPIGNRGLHILGHLAMEGLICFGPRIGKQPTFVLLDEWIRKSKDMTHEEALAEITKRYFTSHGPATLHDFVWWTQLPVTDAKKGLSQVEIELEKQEMNGKTYWFAPHATKTIPSTNKAFLLPYYDEYVVGYKYRDDIIHTTDTLKINNRGGILNPVIVVNGKVIGTWKRTLKNNCVSISLALFRNIHGFEKKAIEEAAKEYATFLGVPYSLHN